MEDGFFDKENNEGGVTVWADVARCLVALTLTQYMFIIHVILRFQHISRTDSR